MKRTGKNKKTEETASYGVIGLGRFGSALALRLAKRLLTGSILDNISLNNDVEIAELRLPDIYVGRSVLDMDLRRKAGLNIIALQHNGKTEIEVDPEYVFREDDILVVIGKKENIRRFEKEKEE